MHNIILYYILWPVKTRRQEDGVFAFCPLQTAGTHKYLRQNKKDTQTGVLFVGGSGWIRTTVAYATDLQSLCSCAEGLENTALSPPVVTTYPNDTQRAFLSLLVLSVYHRGTSAVNTFFDNRRQFTLIWS